MTNYVPPSLPLQVDVESRVVLRQVAAAHRRLAELKGLVMTIPNEEILISTLTLQEARDSSEIENIITTQDELFKAELFTDYAVNVSTKEVQNYASALRKGFGVVRKNKILSTKHILQIQKELEENEAGFRKLPGTALKNAATGETIYTPPQHPDEIISLMDNLEQYINDDNLSDFDPLVKMAIIHHQFESIHPFYDGNGRTGRIINILYLVCKDLLQLPILYLSRYIVEHKGEYYRLLQTVRDNDEWEEWILFMLKGVEETSVQTIELIKDIKRLMQEYKDKIRGELPKIYSQELLNNLFKHPYTKIDFVMEDVRVSRPTATSYLENFVTAGFLEKYKIGKSNFYLNRDLFNLFVNAYRKQDI